MDWTNLPSDLLTRIAGILDLDIADRIRFASVCKPWRSSLQSSSSSLLPQIRLPWLVVSPFPTNANCLTAFTLFSPNPYSLPLTATADLTLFAASNGFFFAFNDLSCCASLVNPITRSQIELPEPVVPIQAVERCKVVSTGRGSFAVMISLSFGRVMVCCREMGGGGGNDDWTELCGDVNVDYVSDFVYFGGFYYVLDEKESETYVVDPKENRVVMVVPSVGRDRPFHRSDRYSSVRRRYLVASSSGEKLFLVIAPSLTGIERFEVFELIRNENRAEWSKVRSIGNDTLFVDTDRALALPAADVDGFRRNCIVFLIYDDEGSTYSSWWVKATGLSMFDIVNDRVEKLPCGDENLWDERSVVWFVPSF